MRARDNPFRAACMEGLPYRMSPAERDALWQRFAAQQYRGLLLGPHGSGKTTLCEELQSQLKTQGWLLRSVVFRQEQAVTWKDLAPLCARDQRAALVIDGLEQIPTLLWLRLRRTLAGIGAVLATSHRPGRLPLLHQHRTSPALLAELISALGQAMPQHDCEELFRTHHGDIRACLRACYDVWAEQADPATRSFISATH